MPVSKIQRKGKKEEPTINANECKCFKCHNVYSEENFYLSYSNFFNRLPVCKKCLCDLFDFYTKKYLSISKAMIQICSTMDVYYSGRLLDSTIENIRNKNGENISIFKNYMRQVNSLSSYQGFTFSDSDIQNKNANIDGLNISSISENEVKWGINYNQEEYKYLNAKYEEWCVTTPHEYASDISSLRDICKQELILTKEPSNDKALKSKSALIKMCGFDGASRRKNDKEKDNVIEMELGCWIEEIEQNEPSYLWDDDKKYTDISGREEYYNKNYIRPMRNICLGKKDFPKVK